MLQRNERGREEAIGRTWTLLRAGAIRIRLSVVPHREGPFGARQTYLLGDQYVQGWTFGFLRLSLWKQVTANAYLVRQAAQEPYQLLRASSAPCVTGKALTPR